MDCGCSVIGAAIIVVGLYCLIWGKSKDHLGNGGKPAVAELPLTSAPNGGTNGYGKHALGGGGGGHHVAAGVEAPPPSSKCVH
jgi:hypothetical protein